MAVITFRCSSCNQGLKVGADKAGRKIKCSKCGTTLTIPAATSPPSPAEVAAPEPPPKPAMDDDDEKGGYNLALVPDAGQDADKKEDTPAKKSDKKPPPIKRKFKTLPDPDLWEKVKAGLQIIMVGAAIWAVAALLMGIMVILGIINGPEYAEVLENSMTVRVETPAGEVVSADMPTFMLGLITGLGYQGIGKTLYILATLLFMAQTVAMMVGYGVCLKIPDRFGTQLQLKIMLGLGAVNFLALLFFKLLPALGIVNYMLAPYAVPEISLGDGNIDRDPAIWVLWSPSPFWEMTLNVLLMACFYGQPVLIGVFVWSIGSSLREEPVIDRGKGVVGIAFGMAFTLLSFHLLSMAGTSGVAIIVLRIVYGGWAIFTFFLILRVLQTLQASRAIIQSYLDGAEIKEEEDEEEEEEEKPKRKKKRRRDEDDDED